MKKISIYEFENVNEYEIFLFDTNTNDIELFNKVYTNYTEAIQAINNLINEYNLQPSDTITNYVFDSNGFTKEVIKETIQEYLQ